MDVPAIVTREQDGKITLPDTVRDRYRLQPGALLRMMETRHGIRLVPLTDAAMSRALVEELQQWQALGTESMAMFPYEDSEA
jgi:hypothetical protein